MQLAEDVGVPAERWQGNWIPHQLRPATEDGIFFVGDSAGHCLPTTAEGIRPAFYFGLALGRELVDVVDGRQTREQALTRYGAFSDDHLWQYRWLLRVQNWVGRITPTRLLTPAIRAISPPGLVRWAFGSYRDICPPEYVLNRSRSGVLERQQTIGVSAGPDGQRAEVTRDGVHQQRPGDDQLQQASSQPM